MTSIDFLLKLERIILVDNNCKFLHSVYVYNTSPFLVLQFIIKRRTTKDVRSFMHSWGVTVTSTEVASKLVKPRNKNKTVKVWGHNVYSMQFGDTKLLVPSGC